MRIAVVRRLGFLIAGLLGLQHAVRAQPTSRLIDDVVIVPEEGVGVRTPVHLFHKACVPGEKPTYLQSIFRVPATVPNPVRSIALRRRDAPEYPLPVFPAFTVEIEIGMGHSPSTPALFSPDLPANRAPDFTLVLPRRDISFAPTTQREGNQYPFTYRFPLERPFTFRPGETAVLEFRIFRSTLCFGNRGTHGVGFETYAMPGETSSKEYGTPCAAVGVGGNRLLAQPMRPGNFGRGVMGLTFGVARVFGGLRNDTWNGLRLPFALDAWGAPGCSLYASLEWEWPTYWHSPLWGFTYVSLSLPNDPNLVGRSVFLQGFAPTRTNALGFETSNGCEVTIGPHVEPPISLLIAPWGPNGVDGGQGTVGLGPVFELSGR